METVIVEPRRGTAGLVAGLLGYGFGVLGVLTLGVVFVPLAAVCSAIGPPHAYISGKTERSDRSTSTSFLAIERTHPAKAAGR